MNDVLKDLRDWDDAPKVTRRPTPPQENDEALMIENMKACADPRTQALRVSVEHYLYLVRQILLYRKRTGVSL